MAERMNRQILLKSRPEGAPSLDNFELVERPMPQAGEGEVLMRTRYLSLDPYMRGRMSDAKSYAKPAEIGQPMVGGTVGDIVSSRHPGFSTGDIVLGYGGWHHAGHKGSAHEKHAVQVDRQHLPPVHKRHLIEGLIGKNAGTVEQDIAATKMSHDVIGKRLDRVHRGYVARAGERSPPGLLDHLHGIIGLGNVGNDDVRPVLGEPFCERLPDTVRAA